MLNYNLRQLTNNVVRPTGQRVSITLDTFVSLEPAMNSLAYYVFWMSKETLS